MQCPEDIRKSLEEIAGVRSVQFDLGRREFGIEAAPTVTSIEIQRAVESAGSFSVSQIKQP